MTDCTCAEDHAESGLEVDLAWWCGMFGCAACARDRVTCGDASHPDHRATWRP